MSISQQKNLKYLGRVFGIAFFILTSISSGISFGETEAAKQDETKVFNDGEDFTRPLRRFDIRLKYQRLKGGYNALINKYRVDAPFYLKNKWQIYPRVDIPMAANDTIGDWKMGLGDILSQIAITSPPQKSFAYGAGIRVIWPSATRPQLGAGKYQLQPLVGFRYSLGFLRDGSFAGLVVRENIGVGGDSDRQDIHQTIFKPELDITLPRDFYLNFEPEILINWRGGAKWFVPFNMEFGKVFHKRIVTSVEWNQGLVKQYPLYDWEMEFRVGYFF